MDSLEVKGIVEGALLSGITVLLVVFSFFIPLFGGFALLVSPVPIIILSVRWGSKISILSSLVVGMILGSLIDPSFALFSIITIGLIGVSMGSALEEGFSSKIVFLIGATAVTLAILLLVFINIYILNVDILALLDEVFRDSLEIYRSIGISEDQIEAAGQTVELMQYIIRVAFISIIFCLGMVVSAVNYYFSIVVLKRLNYDYSLDFSFRRLRFPKWLGYIYILSVLLIGTDIGKNIFIISNFLVLAQGIGVTYYYLLRFKLKKAIILFFLILILLIPFVNHLILVIGLLDIWIDFRSLEKS
ncbi:DUF2232 domain-containing protein [Halonatronum saccharophilum]|uniref:DUF2232 domain-containing protein n=1 Tax=Halonatronum saccharophilum TaxID=150060 RepID=UPI000480666F|nr:DUF2232 domain-containing protein [Halonatronum saccharophilum]